MGAQAVDEGEDAHQHQARAHQDVTDEEDENDEVADDGEGGEGDGVGEGAHRCQKVSRGMTSAVVLPINAETGTKV